MKSFIYLINKVFTRTVRYCRNLKTLLSGGEVRDLHSLCHHKPEVPLMNYSIFRASAGGHCSDKKPRSLLLLWHYSLDDSRWQFKSLVGKWHRLSGVIFSAFWDMFWIQKTCQENFRDMSLSGHQESTRTWRDTHNINGSNQFLLCV